MRMKHNHHSLDNLAVRFSPLDGGQLVNCGPVLNWLPNRLIRLKDEAAINTPAVAAAFAIKAYQAQDDSEISLEVGDLVSVIDMPPSGESVWWRGKRGFEVGFFPSNCVEMIKEASLKRNSYSPGMPCISRPIFPSSVPVSLSMYPPCSSPSGRQMRSPSSPPPTSSMSTQQHSSKTGKLGAFLRFIVTFSSRDNNRGNPVHGGAFGVDLTQHLESSYTEVPLVLQWSASFLEKHGIVEGIYRLSGVISSIDRLRIIFNEHRLPDDNDQSLLQDVHCVASLLKLYFRELPDPLLTYDLCADFIKALQPNYPDDFSVASDNLLPETVKVTNLKKVVWKLPPSHRRTLEFLMRHLSRISTKSSETGMTSKNLAIVWAPNLSRESESQGVAALHLIGIQAIVTEYLIRYVDELFTPYCDEEDTNPSASSSSHDKTENAQQNSSSTNQSTSSCSRGLMMKQSPGGQDTSTTCSVSSSRSPGSSRPLTPSRPAPPPPDHVSPPPLPSSFPPEEEDKEVFLDPSLYEGKSALLSSSVSTSEEAKQKMKRGRFNSVDSGDASRSKLIDVGGGPHSLPPKYHTVIHSVSRSSGGGTFSRRLRRSSSNSGWNNFTVLASNGQSSGNESEQRGSRKDKRLIKAP